MKAVTFAEWLRQELKRRGWNQAELARRLGKNSGTISLWARGVSVPTPESCEQIADVLLVHPDVVLELAGHRLGELRGSEEVENLVYLLRKINPRPDQARLVRALLLAMRDEAPRGAAGAPAPEEAPGGVREVR